MKRILTVLLGALISVSAFAQTESRKLIAGVYDFVTVKSKNWNILEPDFQFIDSVTEKIVFTASFVEKGLPGLCSKYDFTCTVARESNDFNVEITELTSLVCDKKLRPTRNSELLVWPSVTQEKYAAKMKDEISKRMSSWSDAEYEQKFNEAVTSPLVLAGAARSNTVAFKNFMKDYQVIGRSVNTKIYTTDVHEEAKSSKGYSYCVSGKGLCGHITCKYELKEAYFKEPQYSDIMVYTNNNSVISLKPAKRKTPTGRKEAYIENAYDYDVTTGSVYAIKGTIKDVSQNDADAANKICFIEISE